MVSYRKKRVNQLPCIMLQVVAVPLRGKGATAPRTFLARNPLGYKFNAEKIFFSVQKICHQPIIKPGSVELNWIVNAGSFSHYVWYFNEGI